GLGDPVVGQIGCELVGVAADPGRGCLRRPAHDVPGPTRDGQVARAGHGGRLDEEDLPADGRPGEARRYARVLGPAALLREEASLAEQLAGPLGGDLHLALV